MDVFSAGEPIDRPERTMKMRRDSNGARVWALLTAGCLVASALTTACGGQAIQIVPAGPPVAVHIPEHGDGRMYTAKVADASGQVSAPCALPCDLTIPSGTARFTFAAGAQAKASPGVDVGAGDQGPPRETVVEPGGPPPFSAATVIPAHPSEVKWHRQKSGLVIAGSVLGLVGLGLEVPVTIDNENNTFSGGDLGLAVAGAVAALTGLVLTLAAGSDGVDVQ
jgi:hypothetical protein